MTLLMNTKNTKHPKPIEVAKRARQAATKTKPDDGGQVMTLAPTTYLILKAVTSVMYT